MSGYPQQTCLVLLVEDDTITALTLQDEMEDAGYTVAGPFASCAAALWWLATQTPNLAVLDVQLRDGTCKEIAAELNRRDVRFIVYSGYRQNRNVIAELKNCVWVEKPVANSTLLDALGTLWRRPEQKAVGRGGLAPGLEDLPVPFPNTA